MFRGINIYSSPPHPKIHENTPRLAALRSFSRSHDGAHIALDQIIRRIINQTSHSVALLQDASGMCSIGPHDVLNFFLKASHSGQAARESCLNDLQNQNKREFGP